MDTLETALRLITPGCYMASVDLKDAYYTVPIAKEHQKYLWKGQLFQYTCLPNGLASAPRMFTKLLKPMYATLRKLGYTSMGYSDDSLLVGSGVNECKQNISDTVNLLTQLGFIHHPDKSVLVPTQKLTFLGFDIDSVSMTVTLTQGKIEKMITECNMLTRKDSESIRMFAKIIGLMISSILGVEFGPLYCRSLEMAKIKALQWQNGNFEACMAITSNMKKDLDWWVRNLPHERRSISKGNSDITICSDASTLGWGVSCEGKKGGGRWVAWEANHHINYLELLAVYFALRCFEQTFMNKYVKVLCDNTTAVAYINNMGGVRSVECKDIAKTIWLWCKERGIWLTASHLPESLNIDYESRQFNAQTEWQLNPSIFALIMKEWGLPTIDLFASRLNNQLRHFVSWKPDPDAVHIDAFTINWKSHYFYAFRPFSVIGRCTQKVAVDQATGILITPLWPTQPWFTQLLQMLVDHPLLLPRMDNLLRFPNSQRLHPLRKKLQLIACLVSGNHLKSKTYLEGQPRSSWHLGDRAPRNSMERTPEGGYSFVVKSRQIHFIQL
ncbi:uncharacterized protein LOC144445357 [Glandiceps talaboti]